MMTSSQEHQAEREQHLRAVELEARRRGRRCRSSGRSKPMLMKVCVAPGCSKPSPWIGPLTICLGRSNDMK